MLRALFAVVVLLLFATGAAAQSCGALRSELARAQAGAGNNAAVAKLQSRARAFGCNTRSRFGQPRACSGIMAQIRRARHRGGNAARVRQLRRQIARHCGGGRTVARQPRRAHESARLPGRRDGGGFFERLFGDGWNEPVVIDDGAYGGPVERVSIDPDSLKREARRQERSRVAYGTQATRSANRIKGSSREGNARTVCVRLCDGFYFPINARSHSDNYFDEHAMCVGRCPGADVSLYVHHASSPVESMRSAMTNERYVDLPTAFDYRKRRVEGCGCQPQTQMAADMTADRALGYVGIESETRTDAVNDVTNQRPRWRRFRAIYDGTGQPLRLAIGGATLGKASSTSAASDAEGASGSDLAGRQGATGDGLTSSPSSPSSEIAAAPDGASSPPAGEPVSLARGDERVRTVGSSSFTDAVAAFANSERRPIKVLRPTVTSTAVTVLPLPEEIVRPEERAGTRAGQPATAAELPESPGEAPANAAELRANPGDVPANAAELPTNARGNALSTQLVNVTHTDG